MAEESKDPIHAVTKQLEKVSIESADPVEKTRFKALTGLLEACGQKTIVFVRTKRDAARVAGMLKTAGFQVGMVVGGATKSVMEEYRHGRLMVVVATDVLARGIDVPTTGMVVMYDVTVKYEADKRWDQMENFDGAQFKHKVGRCGRQGAKGVAVSLVYDPRSDRVRIEEECFVSKELTQVNILKQKLEAQVASFPVCKEAGPDLQEQLEAVIDTSAGVTACVEPLIRNPGIPMPVKPADTWDDERLRLHPAIKYGVQKVNEWRKPVTVQAFTLPILMGSPKNLIVQSPAGTGKTGCFAMAMLMGCDTAMDAKTVQCLCITPTHELNSQIAENIEVMALQKVDRTKEEHKEAPTPLNLKVVNVRDLKPKGRVAGSLVVGTPEKVFNLSKKDRRSGKRRLDLSKCRLLVLDEADSVVSDGKWASMVRDILKRMATGARVLMFSATYDIAQNRDALAIMTELMGGKDYAKVVVPGTPNITHLVANITMPGASKGSWTGPSPRPREVAEKLVADMRAAEARTAAAAPAPAPAAAAPAAPATGAGGAGAGV